MNSLPTEWAAVGSGFLSDQTVRSPELVRNSTACSRAQEDRVWSTGLCHVLMGLHARCSRAGTVYLTDIGLCA